MEKYYRARLMESDLRMGVFKSCVSVALLVISVLVVLMNDFSSLNEYRDVGVFMIGLAIGINSMLLWEEMNRVVALLRELRMLSSNKQ